MRGSAASSGTVSGWILTDCERSARNRYYANQMLDRFGKVYRISAAKCEEGGGCPQNTDFSGVRLGGFPFAAADLLPELGAWSRSRPRGQGKKGGLGCHNVYIRIFTAIRPLKYLGYREKHGHCLYNFLAKNTKGKFDNRVKMQYKIEL